MAPTFSTHPENLTLKSGEMAELVCAADGEPVPSISWYKGGRLLATGGRTYVLGNFFFFCPLCFILFVFKCLTDFFFFSGQKLRIEHVKESDSGLYVCRADNRAGQAETTARILVKDYRERLPPKFIHTPYNLDVPAGSTIEIPCKADGEPAPVMVWRKDGNVISESKGHYRLSSHGSLYIHSVSFQDAGTYECSAVNDFGKVVANGVLKVKGQ